MSNFNYFIINFAVSKSSALSIRNFSKLYFAFMIFHLVLIYKPDEMILFYISKPLIIVSLLLFYISETGAIRDTGKWKVALALLFSLIGNTVLMWKGETAVLTGIIAFGLTQLFYTTFFMAGKGKSWTLLPLLISVIVVIAAIWTLNLYLPVPSHFRIPISIYSALMGVNFISSIQFGFGSKRILYLIPIGVFLFMVSDLIWAYHQFLFSHVYLQMLFMLFYGLAQYFIVIGVLKYFRR